MQQTKKIKPFLRWAGGKTWLLKYIDDFLPGNIYNNYHEPFLGGGAIFFHLQPNTSILSDLNPELIESYIQVRDNVEELIKILESYKNDKDFYYKLRNSSPRKAATKAARFIYLNKTSFNGIFRVNLKGEYNVPYGYKKNYNVDPENMRNVSKILKNAKIINQDFEKSLDSIKPKDLIFLDPPYTVTHNDNGFIKYNAKLFNEESQLRLAKYIDKIEEIGAYYILTNAAHKWVHKVFKRDSNKIYTLNRISIIGGINAVRGNYEEYLISNIKN
ncbi:Dam family site-specific DNA-(adenine-N6)-methyltransferase [uncultured Dokdonia sp.]|uniref:DNA adenine methylase n=1 Tax=uncultured Dokdonia sp. TaxID=575653 RepID=UPI00261DCA66|nr:Dam family site-specific DNA-(adenine-N6)-methyltransferase [uncultured Dokdonia sp.]